MDTPACRQTAAEIEPGQWLTPLQGSHRNFGPFSNTCRSAMRSGQIAVHDMDSGAPMVCPDGGIRCKTIACGRYAGNDGG